MTIDIEVEARDISPDSVDETLAHCGNHREIVADPRTWDEARRQRRLLLAALADREVAEELLAGQLMVSIECGDVRDCAENALGIDTKVLEEVTLGPVIDTMDGSDRDFFRRAQQDGLFSENAEHFLRAFTSTVVRRCRGRADPEGAIDCRLAFRST